MSDRLAEIEARWREATPGPWTAPFSSYVYSQQAPTKICQLHDPWISNPNERHDATAIASAPDDIAWLVAEVKRLRGIA